MESVTLSRAQKSLDIAKKVADNKQQIEDGKELLSRTDDELALYLIDTETQNIEENTDVLADSLPNELETPDEGRDGNC